MEFCQNAKIPSRMPSEGFSPKNAFGLCEAMSLASCAVSNQPGAYQADSPMLVHTCSTTFGFAHRTDRSI